MKRRGLAGLLAFLMLFTSLGVSPMLAFAEGDTAEIFDDFIEGQTLFAAELSSVDNLAYATSNQSHITNRSRIYKKAADTEERDKNTYLTYYSQSPMQSFELLAELCKDTSSDAIADGFRFEVSEDGEVFTAFADFKLEYNESTAGWAKNTWREGTVRPNGELPENTHYLRIYFPSTAHLETENRFRFVQFGSIRITYKDYSPAVLAELAKQVQDVLSSAEIGDKTGQYTQQAVDTLQAELNILMEVLAEPDKYTPEQMQQAYEKLATALDTFLASANPPSTESDQCDTLTAAYKYDAGIAVATDDAASFGGDSARYVRTDSMTGGSVIYAADEHSTYTSFTVTAWYQKVAGSVPGDISIAAAPIAANPEMEASYQAVEAEKTIADEANWQDGQWQKVTFTVPALPDGTMYVRVTFGDSTATGNAASIQIGSVEWGVNDDGVRTALINLIDAADQAITQSQNIPGMHTDEQIAALQKAADDARALMDGAPSAGDMQTCYVALSAALQEFEDAAVVPERIVDTCDTFDMVYALSSADITLAQTSPEKFDGDGSRFSRSSSKVGEYVIYSASQDKQLTSFQVNVWYNHYKSAIPTDMKIEAAPIWSDPMLDDSYTVVDTVKTVDNGDNWPNGEWRLVHYAAGTLPANTQYVRVTYGDTTATDKSWTIQIGSMEWEERDANYRTLLLPLMNQAADLLTDHTVGDTAGHVPQAAYDQLQNAKTAADEVYVNVDAVPAELRVAFEGLQEAIAVFEDAILRVLNWPEGAVLTTSDLAETSLTLYWPEVRENDLSGITYSVYEGDTLLGTTTTNSYTIENLLQGSFHSYHVIARVGADESKPLGPVTFQTLRYGDMKPPDFSKISPDDFDDMDYMAPLVWGNDTRGVPYYYYNLHKVLNGVVMDGPNKGYVDILVNRKLNVAKTYNPRVQEVYLPITYFYCRDDDWNEYYGNPEVKERLEAIIEHTLSLQFTDKDREGAWPEYNPNSGSLPGTSFTVQYLGQAMRLLREAKKADPSFPSIDQELFDWADRAIRAGIMRVLTSNNMWNTGKAYSNQYGLIWSAALCYLEYHPDDTEMIEAFDKKWAQSSELQSPAGFYYEDSGWDMPYNLGVHTQNIAAEYHYMRGTKYEADLIEHQSKFFDWLSYNLLVEPDGSFVSVNAATSKRSEPSSVVMWHKDFPIAEKIPIARAFVRTKEDVEDEIRRNKEAMTKNGAWPVLPEMTTTGGSQYNPYGLYNRTLYQYFPTDAERQEAIDMLPYNAKEYFTQTRYDAKQFFVFAKRPEYYAIFNDTDARRNASQSFGLGAVYTPEGGTFLLNLGEKKERDDNVPDYPIALNYSWGTKGYQPPLSQDYYRVYENMAWFDVPVEYYFNGQKYMPGEAIDDLPEGELSFHYDFYEQTESNYKKITDEKNPIPVTDLPTKGDKTVTFADNGIEVEVNHPGRFQECFPILMRPEDKVEIFSNQFRIIRGRAVFEIIFDKEVELDLRELGYKNQRATLHQLIADTYDELSYTIVAYTREPELREPSSVVQVEMDDTTATDNSGAAGGDSDLIDSDTPVSWDELDLSGEVSRAQYTAALVDAIGMVGDPARFKEFADVPRDAWYREQILTAVQMGLIIGVDDTHFAPEKPITAEERELILKRAKAFLTGKLVMVEDMNDGK